MYLIEPYGSFLIARQHIIALAFFTLECIGIAVLCEALRKALERATHAERGKDLMFQELAHRTKNNLQMIASVLALQARAQKDPTLRAAFDAAVSRVQVIANAHDRLQPGGTDGEVNLRDYLEDLCRNLGDSLRDLRPVAVRVEVEPIMVGTDKAVPLGLIVNELVTNAFKYAFPDSAEGAVEVSLRRTKEGEVELTVHDNGIGCTSLHEGLGSRLVRLLVQQLGGTIAREPAKPGCLVTARLSL
jgi:two-component sensor histidine kinase